MGHPLTTDKKGAPRPFDDKRTWTTCPNNANPHGAGFTAGRASSASSTLQEWAHMVKTPRPGGLTIKQVPQLSEKPPFYDKEMNKVKKGNNTTMAPAPCASS